MDVVVVDVDVTVDVVVAGGVLVLFWIGCFWRMPVVLANMAALNVGAVFVVSVAVIVAVADADAVVVVAADAAIVAAAAVDEIVAAAAVEIVVVVEPAPLAAPAIAWHSKEASRHNSALPEMDQTLLLSDY
jgi:hypothetical protein